MSEGLSAEQAGVLHSRMEDMKARRAAPARAPRQNTLHACKPSRRPETLEPPLKYPLTFPHSPLAAR